MSKKIRELCLFTLLGTAIYVSKLIMEPFPNIHLISMLIMVYTVVLGVKALYPLYIFVLIAGIYAFFYGSILWWLPYLYIWLFPFVITLLIPKKLPKKILIPIYMVACALHGFLYGTLYAPSQALMFGLDFKGMCAWIISGLPFDAIHGVSNFFMGALVYPLSKALSRVCKKQ